MENKLKVIFIGGLSNGKIVYDYLLQNKYVDLILAITYPDNCNNARHIVIGDQHNIIKSGTTKGYEDKIINLKPDLIMVAGWSELISNNIVNCPVLGAIGFHPSKLPMDRGRSVLAWQIEEGYKETALTMFKYVDYPDGGEILAQEKIKIEDNDYINDILDKMDKATYNLMRAYFPLLRKGLIKSRKQNLSEGNFRRLRNDLDSEINWDTNSINIYNKIRAISNPYPGANAQCGIQRYKIWRAEIVDSFNYGNQTLPGTVVATLYDDSLIVKTRDSFIRLIKYSVIL